VINDKNLFTVEAKGIPPPPLFIVKIVLGGLGVSAVKDAPW
jgi:hypothetical protein